MKNTELDKNRDESKLDLFESVIYISEWRKISELV
mgnify:CR=1 FL=1